MKLEAIPFCCPSCGGLAFAPEVVPAGIQYVLQTANDRLVACGGCGEFFVASPRTAEMRDKLRPEGADPRSTFHMLIFQLRPIDDVLDDLHLDMETSDENLEEE